MTDPRKPLHDLIEDAREEDLPLLADLIARFQRPLDFPLQPLSTGSHQSQAAGRRQEIILQAQAASRSTHLLRRHITNTAERLGITPATIDYSSGSSSIGEGDAVELARNWSEGSALCHLHTFHVENQQIITLGRAEIANSGSEIVYKLRVLTIHHESETEWIVTL